GCHAAMIVSTLRCAPTAIVIGERMTIHTRVFFFHRALPKDLRIRDGKIKLIKLAVPWSKLYTGKVEMAVEQLHLEVESYSDPSRDVSEAALVVEMREAKRKAMELRVSQLRDLMEEQERKQAGAEDDPSQRVSYGVKLVRKIVNNIKIALSDVNFSFINRRSVRTLAANQNFCFPDRAGRRQPRGSMARHLLLAAALGACRADETEWKPDWAVGPNWRHLVDCADWGDDCTASQCCKRPGMQCYGKNEWYSMCTKECAPGRTHDGEEWTCKKLGKRTPKMGSNDSNTTEAPSSAPTAAPSAAPTSAPTAAPSPAPTSPATAAPSPAPTSPATAEPSLAPTSAPTAEPSPAPTSPATAAPSPAPTSAPTAEPSPAPTSPATAAPSQAPTAAPAPVPADAAADGAVESLSGAEPSKRKATSTRTEAGQFGNHPGKLPPEQPDTAAPADESDLSDAFKKQLAGILGAEGASDPEPASAQVGQGRGFDYVLGFGKHGRKTLQTVWTDHPDYLAYIVNTKGLLDARPTLKQAMEEAGVLGPATDLALAMRGPAAQKVLQRADERRAAAEQAAAEGLPPPQVHREIAHLHALQEAEARATLAVAVRLQARERELVARAREHAGKKGKIVTHLKYVSLKQRSVAYEGRPAQRSMVQPARTVKALLRMNPRDFTMACIEDGLLPQMQGAPCAMPGCIARDEKNEVLLLGSHGKGSAWERSTTQCVLGSLHARKNAGASDVTVHTVYSVASGSLIFHRLGGGSTSLTDQVVAFWNCVEDMPVTATCKQLGLSEQVVGAFYKKARAIMAADAERRQQTIIFGQLPGGETSDFEADESCFFSWSQMEGEEKVYKFWVWLGIYQRGAPEKLWLREVGITESRGEGRLPPLTDEFWARACKDVFNERSNMVQMTDSARAYMKRPLPVGIVDARAVNHSRKPVPEFSRSVEVIGNVATGWKRPAVASTNLIDPAWRTLKEEIPSRGAVTAKTDAGRAHMRHYIRTAQWKVMMSTYDRWGAFCQAAAAFEDQRRKDKEYVPDVSRLAAAMSIRWQTRKRKAMEADALARMEAPPTQQDPVTQLDLPAPMAACPAPMQLDPPAAPAELDAPMAACPAPTQLRPATAPARSVMDTQRPVAVGRNPPEGGWWCALLGARLGARDNPPAWYNNPRTGAIGPRGTQTAATCAIHAVQHLIAQISNEAVVTREAFERKCVMGFDGGGNYEYADMHTNLEHLGCRCSMVTPDEVETITASDADGSFSALFRLGVLEGTRVLGFLLHVPGHWVCIVPGAMGGPDAQATLCDSLFPDVFWLTGLEVAELLEAMAIHSSRQRVPHGAWSAYRVYLP
ncbi:unnamed protein product, partial [Prorocentrum cordatum]